MRTFLLRSVETALRRGGRASSHLPCRTFSVESSAERKVSILGAAGGIGEPLALLMKLNALVSSLSLYDIAGTPGVAADVSHINTRAQVPLSVPSLISFYLSNPVKTLMFWIPLFLM